MSPASLGALPVFDVAHFSLTTRAPRIFRTRGWNSPAPIYLCLAPLVSSFFWWLMLGSISFEWSSWNVTAWVIGVQLVERLSAFDVDKCLAIRQQSDLTPQALILGKFNWPVSIPATGLR
ncbi:hypothetical protein NA56DRAFT_278812 [Hyaloscypha hepaticicola]|uniref:Uncharacterized protein n=1 Tax=Hyaloscypha hepaticicola TaxID=2082293 RepID=A0A2J6PTS8_9HELO|nr:hypothetical protein NA56DRAFT_278812 [Hyaloscypha hepaticicola]